MPAPLADDLADQLSSLRALLPFVGGGSLGGGRTYDVGADGRFLMIKRAKPDSSGPSLVVVQNWFEELKRRVPTN